jgi:mono/diheme cytochrome c family protein
MMSIPAFIYRLGLWLSIATTVTGCSAPVWAQDVDPASLGNQARNVLQEHCWDCHGSDIQESGLRLDTRRGLERGGDFGPVVNLADSQQSELLRRVTSQDDKIAMPLGGQRLTESEIQILSNWIQAGAVWPPTDNAEPEETDPRLAHWAWQDIGQPAAPDAVAGFAKLEGIEPERNAIDFFVRKKLFENGLTPSPLANRQVLVRRLYFDLIGLPPPPEEVTAFVNDPAPDAYERLVERLLASPRYGERWARHWLDVVHYGDTHGYDKDQPRPNAWPYRDYVIRSFNQDKPYSRFVEEQIAGDVLYAETRDGQEALGFIAAGPWDFIGHREVPETKTDGKIARHLDRDDMVSNTLGSFASVTIHCAQCHHHKFDPISQADYYALQAVFAAIDRDELEYSRDPDVQPKLTELKSTKNKLQREQTLLEEKIREELGSELAELDRQINPLSEKSSQGGYHSKLESSANHTKWLQLDLGQETLISEVRLHPCYDDFNGIGPGFGFPARYRIELSNDADFVNGEIVFADSTEIESVPRSVTPAAFNFSASCRFVRVTVTQLAPRANDFCFALAEIEVVDSAGKNVALGQPVSALDSTDIPSRWRGEYVVDGQSPALALEHRSSLEAEKSALIAARGLSTLSDELTATRKRLESIEEQRKSLESIDRVYAATTHLREGAPRPIHLLSRGNVLAPRQEVGPGALPLVSQLPNRFELPVGHPESERRKALARWLTDARNPLTWRSIVNRIWQYHFGVGIVDTPDDLGLNGGRPTHPELLDWMATKFRDDGGSLKNLHRLIVNSATYRQSSLPQTDMLNVDAENRLLWRSSPRRLDAESIRDSVLFVAGTLDLTMGGPGWQDFKIENPEHSPHYRYDLADPKDRATWRRSIYRFVVRSQTQPFMTVLDCADPSMRVERRNQSITPLQALALLNNGLMLAQAEEMAKRVRNEAGQALDQQVMRAFHLALGRAPTDSEIEVLLEIGEKYGLENICRALFNLNEFIWID